jgi:hypothetical protein
MGNKSRQAVTLIPIVALCVCERERQCERRSYFAPALIGATGQSNFITSFGLDKRRPGRSGAWPSCRQRRGFTLGRPPTSDLCVSVCDLCANQDYPD